MAEYYTVSSLAKKLKELEEQGLGNKYVAVPTDDEGNDYRVLLDQDILVEKDDIEEYVDEDYNSIYVNTDEIVVL